MHAEPPDAVMFCTSDGDWAFEYYTRQQNELTRTASTTPVALYPLPYDAKIVETRTGRYRRVWLVLHQDIRTIETDKNIELLREALQKHFRLIDQTEFRGSSPPGRSENGTILVALYSTPERESQ